MLLFQALYSSFWGVFVVALLAVLSSWLIPVAGRTNAASSHEETSVTSRDKVDATD